MKNGMLILLLAVCCLLCAAGVGAPQAQQQAQQQRPDETEKLLETGRAARLAPTTESAPAEIKIVSYNVRYRGGEELQKLIALLRDDREIGNAAIIGLQEVDRNKKRTDNINTARLIAEGLGMYYAWAAPPQGEESDEEETGVTLLSPYRMTEVRRIVLPHEGPKGRRRVALGATLHVGDELVRVYTVHAETRMPLEKKIEHWRGVLDDLSHFAGLRHVVVLGDFNTIKEKDVRAARRLFTNAGFHTPFPDSRDTWKSFLVGLKLDWVWLRGMKMAEYGIDQQVDLSDHWPLWVKVKLEKKGAPSPFTALQPPSPLRVR